MDEETLQMIENANQDDYVPKHQEEYQPKEVYNVDGEFQFFYPDGTLTPKGNEFIQIKEGEEDPQDLERWHEELKYMQSRGLV